MIKITDEYLEKVDDNEEFDQSYFDTDQEVEVRIPFTGYYSLNIKCTDPQVAMAYTLGAVRYAGIDMFDSEMEIEELEESETYIEE